MKFSTVLNKKWDFCTCTTLTEILIQGIWGWAQSFALFTRTQSYFDACAPSPHLEKSEVVLHIEVEAVGDSGDNSLSPPFLHRSPMQVTVIEKRFLCPYPKPYSWERREKEQYIPSLAAHENHMGCYKCRLILWLCPWRLIGLSGSLAVL